MLQFFYLRFCLSGVDDGVRDLSAEDGGGVAKDANAYAEA